VRQLEAEQDGVVAEACGMHALQGHPVVNVLVYWPASGQARQSDRRELVSRLADAVATHVPEPGRAVELEFDGTPGCPIPAPVSTLRVFVPLGRIALFRRWPSECA